MSNTNFQMGLDEDAINEVVKEMANSPLSQLAKDFDLHNKDFADQSESRYGGKDMPIPQTAGIRLVAVSCPRAVSGGYGTLRDMIFYGPREALQYPSDVSRAACEWMRTEGLSTNFAVNEVSTPIQLNAEENRREREKGSDPSSLYKVKVTLISTNI